jgi:EmrB/QacA subfamily drug resistance transporter
MSKAQKNLLLLGLMLGVLLEGLDGMVLSTAMPRIIADLNGLQMISWVFTSYMLTSVLSTPIYGKLSDLYGRKQFYIGGMLIFMVASMLAGQAQSIEWLIFWRGVQGLGAGAMMPIAMSISADVFSGPDRGKIQGIISGGFGISSILGPTLGGWITDGPGWRWAFYVNVPLGIAVIAIMLLIKMPAFQRATEKIHIDYLGAATLMAFTTTLLLGFVFGGDETIGWTQPQTIAMFVVAVVSLFAFIFAESKAADPIISLSFFKNPVFVVANTAGFLTGAAMFGSINYISYFIQGVQGESATHSGTAVTPMMLALVVGSVIGGQVMGKVKHYRIPAVIFMAIIAAGIAQLVLLNVHSGTLEVLAAMITIGFGIGGTFPIFIIAMQNALEPRYMGTVNSLNGFFRQIGATIGISIMGSILNEQLTKQVPERMHANLPNGVYEAMTANGFKPNVQILTSSEGLGALKNALHNDALYSGVVTSLREALANSLNLLFIGSLGIAIVAAVVTIFLKEVPLRFQAAGSAMMMEGGHASTAPATMTADEKEEVVEVA